MEADAARNPVGYLDVGVAGDRRDGRKARGTEPESFRGPGLTLRRGLLVLGAVSALAAMLLVPPLVNVNRYRRKIASSISASLGRPVRLDAVVLNVLPLPGFTLQNFVVEEDPAFGAEPVIRADSVRATLRMRSLWRRRVEFSRITLTDPSVNLVHLPDGRWNLESILVQASRMPAAPTTEREVGGTQRFPYIEATGARLNLKLGGEKTPFSLTDADFALWLPEPEHWRLRLLGHPARTDTAVSDTGTARIEGTLGRAAALARVPVDLRGEWTGVPLGSLSLIALGRDAGMRGEMSLTASVRGTVGDNLSAGRVQIAGLRRAEFVPAQAVIVDLGCTARARNAFLTLDDVRCGWPASENGPGVQLRGTVPDTHQPESATGEIVVNDVPASVLLAGWRVASERVPTDTLMEGLLKGRFSRSGGVNRGQIEITGARLGRKGRLFVSEDISAALQGSTLTLDPFAVDLGADDPVSVSGTLGPAGISFNMNGSVSRPRLQELRTAVPQFGDGLDIVLPPASEANLKTPLTIHARATRGWGGGQNWVEATPARVRATRRHR